MTDKAEHQTGHQTERYAVLDDTGKIREWLDSGRGIAIWRDQQISSSPAPDRITPADGRAGHWRYGNKPERVIMDPSGVAFYLAGPIVRHWTDTAQGHDAAERHIDTLPADNRRDDGTWPPTRLLYRYTVRTFKMRAYGADGPLTYRAGGHDVPLAIEYRCGVQRWTLLVDETSNPVGTGGAA